MAKTLVLSIALFLAACSQPEDPPPLVPETAAKATKTAPAAPAPTEPRQSVVIAADPWCPHNCEAGSEHEGYMIDIAREAFGLAGIDVEYVNMSWARALQQARDGYIDAVVGALPGDAPDFVFPDAATGYSTIALYTHPDNNWQYAGIDSLSQSKLLAINGYAYSPELDSYIEKYQDDPERVWVLSGPAPLSRAIELLHQQRSDVFPEDRYVMQWQLEQENNTESLRMAAVIHESPIYVAFSPVGRDSAQLAALMSEGARALQSSGRVEEILTRYGLSWSD
ncbi:amino acid ABC transporter substrate-binding protein (PAAT family) [Marinobacter sp. 3-2]|jgi:polar amino acid transport system substrate-binding protein|uniref:substrate-binding periplasmic protein n=1 Tax=Marinobacter sp. 3-2 TaxID=2485141 RepID=UPI000D33F546|nr:transporter substrate-binding domain-containing protein [Marinobacter sp. 3-2]ROQ45019.1 amino acid ABC transporter substrate-binding protein (PAAT family) [Marinobacter sp. 3-2]